MKGDTCGFLHEFNPERMPVCRSLLKYGICKEPDCPYKHSLTDIKVRYTHLLHSGILLKVSVFTPSLMICTCHYVALALYGHEVLKKRYEL